MSVRLRRQREEAKKGETPKRENREREIPQEPSIATAEVNAENGTEAEIPQEVGTNGTAPVADAGNESGADESGAVADADVQPISEAEKL